MASRPGAKHSAIDTPAAVRLCLTCPLPACLEKTLRCGLVVAGLLMPHNQTLSGDTAARRRERERERKREQRSYQKRKECAAQKGSALCPES